MSKIDNILDKNINKFAKQLQAVSKNIQLQLLPYLNRLQLDGAIISSDKANLDIVLAFADEFKTVLANAGYNNLLQEYLDNTASVIKDIKKASESFSLPYAFAASDLDVLEGLQKIDLMELGNIGEKAAATLQTGLMNSVLAGQQYDSMFRDLTAKLDNNLVRYAQTYIDTSRSQLLQKIEDISAEKRPGEDYWEYVGPKDTKNREECAQALEQKVFTAKERQDFENIYGLRYNCRHTFHAITYKEFVAIRGE